MDEYAGYNRARWEELAAANVDYSRPMLDLTIESARQLVDPYHIMGDVKGKDVLCLASGGGQQSAAFGLLGAKVVVLDFSPTQLERDRTALAHYGLHATLVEGDMRNLSRFGREAFDLVWHAFSINFVAEAGQVFDEVRHVLRPNGCYRLQWHNPFTVAAEEAKWTGQGYEIKHRYRDGEIRFEQSYWDVYDADGIHRQVEGPREFNHTLSTVVNGLIARGFVLLGLWETLSDDPDASPGTWDHRMAVLPPWLTLWARYQPGNA